MSSSPEWAPDAVLRGAGAESVEVARFDADLTSAASPVAGGRFEEARAAARAAGYAEGWAQGQRAARVAAQAVQDQIAAERRAEDAARAAQVRRAVDALARAAEDLAARSVPAIEAIEDVVLATAVELAEALLGHELTAGAARDVHALRRALAAAPGPGAVTVRLHPDDCRTLTATLPEPGEFDGRPVELVADPTLAPGDAVAETGMATVDATLAGAVARVRQALGL